MSSSLNSLRTNIREHLKKCELDNAAFCMKASLVTVFATAESMERDMAYAPTEIASALSHHGMADEDNHLTDIYCVPCKFDNVPFVDTVGTGCKSEIDAALLRIETDFGGVEKGSVDEIVVYDEHDSSITWRRDATKKEEEWYQRCEKKRREIVAVLPLYVSDIRVESCIAQEKREKNYKKEAEKVKIAKGCNYRYRREVSTLLRLPKEDESGMGHTICKKWVYTMDAKDTCIDLTLHIELIFAKCTLNLEKSSITSMLDALLYILPQTQEPIQPTKQFVTKEDSTMSTDQHIQKLCDSANVGPHPVALCRSHVKMIREKDEFKLSEKTNGVRMLFVQFTNDKQAALQPFSRHLKNMRTGDNHTREDLTANTNLEKLGECVLDGELVWNMHFGCMVFMIFDAYALKGKNLTARTFNQRQRQLETVLSTDDDDHTDWRIPTFNEKDVESWLFKKLPFVVKRWVDAPMLYSQLAVHHDGANGIYNDGTAWYYHESDGYIAQPDKSLRSEEGKTLYKYKTPKDTSIDYRVDETMIGDLSSMAVSYPDAAMQKKNVSNVNWNDADKQRLRRRYPEGNAFMFCEFVYNGYWTPIFPRVDKMSANMSVTVVSTLAALKDHMTTEEFIIRMCASNVEETLRSFKEQEQHVFEYILENNISTTPQIQQETVHVRQPYLLADGYLALQPIELKKKTKGTIQAMGKCDDGISAETFVPARTFRNHAKRRVIEAMMKHTNEDDRLNQGCFSILDVGGDAGDRELWASQHDLLREKAPQFRETIWSVIDASQREVDHQNESFYDFKYKRQLAKAARTAYDTTLDKLNELGTSASNPQTAADVAGEVVGIAILLQVVGDKIINVKLENACKTAVAIVQETLLELSLDETKIRKSILAQHHQGDKKRSNAEMYKANAIESGVSDDAKTPDEVAEQIYADTVNQHQTEYYAAQLAGLAAGIRKAKLYTLDDLKAQFIKGNVDELIYSNSRHQEEWAKVPSQYTAVSCMFMLQYIASSEPTTKQLMSAFYHRLQEGCCIAICIPDSDVLSDRVAKYPPNALGIRLPSYLSGILNKEIWGQCYHRKSLTRGGPQTIERAEYLIPRRPFLHMVEYDVGFEIVYLRDFNELWKNWQPQTEDERLKETQYCAMVLRKPKNSNNAGPAPKQMRRTA